MNIYDLPQENDYIRLKLFIWLLTIHIIWSFSINTTHFEQYISFLRLMPEIFDISIWWTSLWLLGIKHFQYKSFSLFPSQILVCATVFATHYVFSFWDLHLLNSLSKNNKKCGKIYRHKSMQVSKPPRLLTNHS